MYTGVDVATIRNNLASVYEALGRYEEAEKLIRQALETDREMLDPSHPNIANDLLNLGYVQHQQGKVVEAEESFAESLNISEQVKTIIVHRYMAFPYILTSSDCRQLSYL